MHTWGDPKHLKVYSHNWMPFARTHFCTDIGFESTKHPWHFECDSFGKPKKLQMLKSLKSVYKDLLVTTFSRYLIHAAKCCGYLSNTKVLRYMASFAISKIAMAWRWASSIPRRNKALDAKNISRVHLRRPRILFIYVSICNPYFPKAENGKKEIVRTWSALWEKEHRLPEYI